jgi:hypothetical protein
LALLKISTNFGCSQIFDLNVTFLARKSDREKKPKRKQGQDENGNENI